MWPRSTQVRSNGILSAGTCIYVPRTGPNHSICLRGQKMKPFRFAVTAAATRRGRRAARWSVPCGISSTRSRTISGNSARYAVDFVQIGRRVDDELQLVLVLAQAVAESRPADAARARAGDASADGARPAGAELANFGLIDIRSQATGRYSVPAVSIVMCRPIARSRSQSGISSANSIGSPPVTTTCRVSHSSTWATISSIDMSRAFGPPRGVRRIAEPAAQVAAAGAHEHARHAGEQALALHRTVDFGNSHDTIY